MTTEDKPEQDSLLQSNSTENLKGIIFVLLSCLSMTLSAILIRYIGKELGSFEVVLIRCCFTLLITLTLNARLGAELFKATHPALLLLRSAILSFVVLGNFYAIVHLPLVQVTSLQFTKPLFLVVLAALFLGEYPPPPNDRHDFVGFIGILIILRPDGTIQLAQMAVLLAAIGMATLAVITEKINHPACFGHFSLLWKFFYNSRMPGPTILLWHPPSLLQFTLIAGLGLSSYGAQIFMVQAYRHGETTVVTPFEYIRLIFIAIAAYIIFGEIPDGWTILGAVIICSATLFIAYRQARRKTSKEIA